MRQTIAYPAATMEVSDSTVENAFYTNLTNTRVAISSVSGYPTDTYSSPNNYTAKTNGSRNKIGPAIVLKVMAGDQFNVRVSSWYYKNGATPATPYNPVNDIITALTNSIGTVGGSKATPSQLVGSGILNPGALSYYSSHTGDSTTKPKAYLNWVLFDEQFNFVSSSSGFQQVGNDNTLTVLGQNTIPVTKNGYLYIYVSNETPNIDVYFDNLQVTHIRGPLLQEEGYYPFGLQMQGISSQALNIDKLPNSYKFNGGDELEESINLYSTFYRGYDPQLGRFNGVDVMSEQSAGMSPYHFGGNNPIMMNDPMGNLSISPSQFYQYSSGIQQQINDMADPMDHRDDAMNWSDQGGDDSDQPGGTGVSEYTEKGGGNRNLGNDDYTDPWQKILDRITEWTGQGFTVSSINFRDDGVKGFGAYMMFEYSGTDYDNGLIGLNDFVALPELKNTFRQLKEVTGLGIAATIVGASSSAYDLTQNTLLLAQKLANQIGGTSYLLKNIGDYKLFKLGNLGDLNLNAAGKILGAVGVAIPVITMIVNGKADWSNGTDAVMGMVAFVPVVGWIISGTYFFTDMILKSMTGKSAGDYLGDYWNSTHFFTGLHIGNAPL